MKYILITVALFLSKFAYAQQSIDLVYSGFKLDIPAGFTLVASDPGDGNILIFRYGPDKGQRYVAFTDMSDDTSIDYGCDIVSFYNSLFSSKKAASCNVNNLEILKDVFINDRDIEVLEKGQYRLNLSSGKGANFAFITGAEGKILKVDTDFLSKAELKAIFNSL